MYGLESGWVSCSGLFSVIVSSSGSRERARLYNESEKLVGTRQPTEGAHDRGDSGAPAQVRSVKVIRGQESWTFNVRILMLWRSENIRDKSCCWTGLCHGRRYVLIEFEDSNDKQRIVLGN